MKSPISQLLDGTWLSPDTGNPVSIPIRHIEIRKDVAADAKELVDRLGFGKHIAVVSDANTHHVLGEGIEKALAGAYKVTPIVLSARPEADETNVSHIRKLGADADAFIAVGSGTINDLTKYASCQEGKPYAVFGTAPSMNGYSSANAAITVRGHKKSLQAQLPAGIFLDLDVLAAAPKRLIRSGLGDSLCRSTAQADWLLSHELFDTPYLITPFTLLEADETPLFEQAEALMSGDGAVMEYLARTLVLSGLGMYLVGGSYPASQAEHMISHTMEMVYKSKAAGREGASAWPLHGEQIGVTTLTMSRLQHKLLGKRPVFHADHVDEKAILYFFGEETGKECIEEFRRKAITAQDAERLNDHLSMYWLSLRAKLAAVMVKTEILEGVLNAAGAPTSPENLGWSRMQYNLALRHAPFTRDRFTFLDLARVGRHPLP